MTLADIETAFKEARVLTLVVIATQPAGWRVSVRVSAGSRLHDASVHGLGDALRMFDGPTIEAALGAFVSALAADVGAETDDIFS